MTIEKIIVLLIVVFVVFVVGYGIVKIFQLIWINLSGEQPVPNEILQHFYDIWKGKILPMLDEFFPEVEEEGVKIGKECKGNFIETGYNCWGGCKLRESALKKLREAEKIAKNKGVTLVISSAYRSEKKQEELWNKKPYRKWVCGPRDGSFAHCPHVTGCAIDVYLKGKNMDEENQKLLEDIMYRAGFIRYCREYWHFEYGTNRWEKGMKQNKRCA